MASADPGDPNYDSLEGPVGEANIYRRNGGCGVVVDEKLYVWGGEGAEKRALPGGDSDSEDDSEEEEEEAVDVWTVTTLPPSRFGEPPFDVYDLQTRGWSRQKTCGDAPLLGLGSSLSYHPETRTFYLFGGWNGGNFDAEVYRMQLDRWRWEKVEIGSGNMKPSGRYLTGVLIHESRLCVLGGVGLDIVKLADGTPQDVGAAYIEAYSQDRGFGWNNEYYELDMQTDTWSAPLGKDAPRPAPLGGHCFAKFDDHRALLFGGRYESGRVNDTWIFNLQERKFTGPLRISAPLPTGRTFASLTPLIDPQIVGHRLGGCGPVLEQQMLLLWGKLLNDVILPEAWILNNLSHPNHLTWNQLDIDMFPRSWHIAAPLYYTNSTECQVAIFGGNVHSDGFTGKRRNTADMRVLRFGLPSLSRLCARVLARQLQGRDLSCLQLPPHSQHYRHIYMATQALANNTAPSPDIKKKPL